MAFLVTLCFAPAFGLVAALALVLVVLAQVSLNHSVLPGFLGYVAFFFGGSSSSLSYSSSSPPDSAVLVPFFVMADLARFVLALAVGAPFVPWWPPAASKRFMMSRNLLLERILVYVGGPGEAVG